jgi:predicted ATPase/DNA-binding winged helix-turn-helix (wHTH) protein
MTAVAYPATAVGHNVYPALSSCENDEGSCLWPGVLRRCNDPVTSFSRPDRHHQRPEVEIQGDVFHSLSLEGDSSAVDNETYAFGSFQLIPAQRLLLDNGRRVQLGSRVLDILSILVERAGETVSNEDIMGRAWPTTRVEEGSIRVHIGALRKTLGEGGGGARFIVNVPSRGYTFVAPVSRAQDQSPAPAAPVATPAAGGFTRSLVNIVGRADTIATAAAQLGRRRLLTIVGPGGIGKTTVAGAVAQSLSVSCPDGVWFVALASLSDPALVASAISAALGIAVPGNDPLPALIMWLRDKQALIVLDNCEHVVDTAAAVAEEILRTTDRVSILATSREPLRCVGEFIHRLAPLGIPPQNDAITTSEALGYAAVQLFNERARANDDSFAFADGDAPLVCEICRKLDGLPLALELAAAQVQVFGLRGLARALNDRFALLIKGRRTAIQRQQTLHATLDWGYELLPEIEKIVFRRLAVFSGDFTMEAAQAVARDDRVSDFEVIESVANLATKSLIPTDISGDVTSHRLLETTRAYALEKLTEDAETNRLKRRHAEYFRDFFEPAEDEGSSRGQADWLTIYGRHIDNVRIALDWAFSPEGDARIGVALTAAAVPLWIHLSLLGECRERVERALANLDTGSAETARSHMRLSAALAWSLMYGVGRARETSTALHTTLELAAALGDTHYQLRALWGLCIDQFNTGTARGALAFARRFADLAAQSTEPIELMMAHRIQGTALHYLGDQNAAIRHIDRALAHEDVASWRPRMVSPGFDLVVSAHYFQARVQWLRGFAEQAMRIVEHNIEEGLALNQALTFCSVLGQAGCPVALLGGELDAAEQYGAMLLEHTERHQIRLWNIWARCFNGLVIARRGDVAGGLRVLREGLVRAGDARFLPRFLFLEGEQALYLGSVGESELALASVDQMLARCAARDERWYVPELLRIKGELMRAAGTTEVAGIEALFRQSLEEAGQSGALAWELRTATSLAHLWRDLGRASEAAALLRPVYARLSEGFTTVDARAARSLLEMLS